MSDCVLGLRGIGLKPRTHTGNASSAPRRATHGCIPWALPMLPRFADSFLPPSVHLSIHSLLIEYQAPGPSDALDTLR